MAEETTGSKEQDGKLDKILGHLDSLHAKHDALMAKHDALELKHDLLAKRMDALDGKAPGNISPEDEAAERREREELERTDAARRIRKDAEREQEETPKFIEVQRRVDEVAQAFGDSGGAPRWLAGESLADCRRRLLSKYQAHSRDWKGVSLAGLHEDALAVAEPRIIADALAASKSPDVVPGVLRTVKSRDQYGRTITKFFGDPLVAYAPFMFNGLIRQGRIRDPSSFPRPAARNS